MINGLSDRFDLSETEAIALREHLRVVAETLFVGGCAGQPKLTGILRGKLIDSLIYLERHKAKLSQVYQRELEHILREARFRLQRDTLA